MVGAVDAVLITGFWLTACVAATATSCPQRLGGGSRSSFRSRSRRPASTCTTRETITRRLSTSRPSSTSSAPVGVVVCDDARRMGASRCGPGRLWPEELREARPRPTFEAERALRGSDGDRLLDIVDPCLRDRAPCTTASPRTRYSSASKERSPVDSTISSPSSATAGVRGMSGEEAHLGAATHGSTPACTRLRRPRPRRCPGRSPTRRPRCRRALRGPTPIDRHVRHAEPVAACGRQSDAVVAPLHGRGRIPTKHRHRRRAPHRDHRRPAAGVVRASRRRARPRSRPDPRRQAARRRSLRTSGDGGRCVGDRPGQFGVVARIAQRHGLLEVAAGVCLAAARVARRASAIWPVTCAAPGPMAAGRSRSWWPTTRPASTSHRMKWCIDSRQRAGPTRAPRRGAELADARAHPTELRIGVARRRDEQHAEQVLDSSSQHGGLNGRPACPAMTSRAASAVRSHLGGRGAAAPQTAALSPCSTAVRRVRRARRGTSGRPPRGRADQAIRRNGRRAPRR